MLKRIILSSAFAVSLLSASVVPSNAQDLAAACATSASSCAAFVRSILGPNPTAAQIEEIQAQLGALEGVPAEAIAEAYEVAAELTDDPVVQDALTQLAEAALDEVDDTPVADIDPVGASPA